MMQLRKQFGWKNLQAASKLVLDNSNKEKMYAVANSQRFQTSWGGTPETQHIVGPQGDTYEEIFTGNYAKERDLVSATLRHATKEQEILFIGLPCYGYPWVQRKVAKILEEIQPQSIVADLDRKTMIDMKEKDDKGRVVEDSTRFQFGYGLLPSAVAMFEGLVEGAKYGANWIFVDQEVIYRAFGFYYRTLFTLSTMTGLLMPKEVQKILFVRPEYPEQPVVMLEQFENKERLAKYFRRVAPNIPTGLVDHRVRYLIDELIKIDDQKIVGLVGEIHVKELEKAWADKMKALMEQIEK